MTGLGVKRAIEAHLPQKALRDRLNRWRFGPGAPLSDAAIFPAPRDVNHVLRWSGPRAWFTRQQSGRVRGGDWDLGRGDIEASVKLMSCRMRWCDGADWEETPIVRRLLAEVAAGKVPDGCRTPQDVHARYARLDALFAETRAAGRLKSRSELPESYRREHGGIMMHIARDGTCLRSGGGAHRFAIARILDLPEVPAQVGVIHPQAWRDGHYTRLRTSRFDPPTDAV